MIKRAVVKTKSGHDAEKMRGAATSLHSSLAETLMPTTDDDEDAESVADYNTNSCWYKLGKCTVRCNWLVMGVMAVAVAPFVYFVPQLSLLHQFTLVAPRGANSSIA